MGRWRSRYSRYSSYSQWPEYVPVAERRLKAQREAAKLGKKGEQPEPVAIEGRTIARSFWGKAWCTHLESFSDYSNRLPRGRSYLSNGLVVDLKVQAGSVRALVSGSSLYTVEIGVEKLPKARWSSIRSSCAGRIDTLVELLQGRISDDVMRRMCDRAAGLFPSPAEIEMQCSCPDYAEMCKHVAAALYGVGARLDAQPELLFTLRGVDHLELVAGAASAAAPAPAAPAEDALAGVDLGALFGIDVAATAAAVPERARKAVVPALVKTARNSPAKRPAKPARSAEPDALFSPGEDVYAGDLVAIGIPRTTFGNWVTAGALARTGRRGVYLATPALNEKVLAFLVAREVQ